jgi:hypothetical protein
MRALALHLREARLLREPLVHFLLIGAILFAANAMLEARKAEDTSAPSRSIRITSGDVDWLRHMWARQWGRAPTDEQLTGLVADHLKEEILAREARAQQLDVDDTVVRRRLAQKLSFLLEDTIRVSEPSEAELRALYDGRPDLAAVPARVSFEHAFYARQKGGEAAARIAFAALTDDADAPAHGDRFLLGDAFSDQDEQSLSNMFGETFAHAVFAAERGRWSGPFTSDYGVHLVKVTDLQPPRRRAFHEVRDRLSQEWRREREGTARQQLYAGLMRKYRIAADPAVSQFVPSTLVTGERER